MCWYIKMHCCSCLSDAIRANHANCLRSLLLHSGADANEENEEGATPLTLADHLKRWQCIDVLLDFGAKPRWNDYLLFEFETLHLLIDHGASPRDWDICQVSRSVKRQYHDYQSHVQQLREQIDAVRDTFHLPREIIEMIAKDLWETRKEHWLTFKNFAA